MWTIKQSIAVGLSLAFYMMHTNWRGPLTAPELEKLLDRVHNYQNVHEGETGPDMIPALRSAAENDDGKEFFLANMVDFRNNEDFDANMATYKKMMLPALITRFAYPVYTGSTSGVFMLQGMHNCTSQPYTCTTV
jgi:hypothetical protein